MASWTQTEWRPGLRVWQRSLGVTEGCFYWDSVIKGTTDTVVHVYLYASRPDDTQIYSHENVHRAWSSVKRRYPLMAAEVHEDGHDARFIVREENVSSLREDDVTFATVSSFQDADQFVTDLLDGSPPLSSEHLTRIYVLARTDRSDEFHIVLVIAHCIADACSTSTIVRVFLHTLASSYDPAPLPISLRLQTCLSLESRLCYGGLSLARQRWRRAIGFAMHVVRLIRFKGGHTLPAHFSTATNRTPAKPRIKVVTFSRAMSDVVLSTCHRDGIPLTCAFYALSQVVLSRVLCRRYLRGEISDDEWAYRTREPMFFNGPINLRPYMDTDWFRHGGSGEVGLNASFAQYILPRMPMCRTDTLRTLDLVDGAPDFPALMSRARFLHRCRIVKAQVEKLFDHPRFVDICTAGYRFRLPIRHAAADAWRSQGAPSKGIPIPVPSMGAIMTQDGSSMGNMDDLLPLTYPLPATHRLSPVSPRAHPHRAGYVPQPIPDAAVHEAATRRLDVAYWRTHVRVRPAELYLGSWTMRGQLQLFMLYDEGVYDGDVVAEWMGEMAEAVKWYFDEPVVPPSRL